MHLYIHLDRSDDSYQRGRARVREKQRGVYTIQKPWCVGWAMEELDSLEWVQPFPRHSHYPWTSATAHASRSVPWGKRRQGTRSEMKEWEAKAAFKYLSLSLSLKHVPELFFILWNAPEFSLFRPCPSFFPHTPTQNLSGRAIFIAKIIMFATQRLSMWPHQMLHALDGRSWATPILLVIKYECVICICGKYPCIECAYDIE